MSIQLQPIPEIIGGNLKIVIFDSEGKVWNGSALVFYVASQIDSYGITMTEGPSGFYSVDFPPTLNIPGTYKIIAFHQLGGALTDTDPQVGVTDDFEWDGMHEILTVELNSLYYVDSVLAVISANGASEFANQSEQREVLRILNGIIKRAEQFCNTNFAKSLDIKEIVKPYGNKIYLNSRPIISFTSLFHQFPQTNAIPTDEVSADDFWINEIEGYIEKKSGSFFPENYIVNYDAGYSPYGSFSGYPFPDDIASALLDQLKFEFASRGSLHVSSESNQIGTVTRNRNLQWLPSVQSVLESYTKFNV